MGENVDERRKNVLPTSVINDELAHAIDKQNREDRRFTISSLSADFTLLSRSH